MDINGVYFGIIGGALIGISAVGMMLTLGRITGVSGMIQASIWSDERSWRLFFIIGLVLSTSLFHAYFPDYNLPRQGFPLWLLAISGLLVGLGVALGNGCTSGHGICGVARFSKRSIIATIVFFTMALLTRYLFNAVWELTP